MNSRLFPSLASFAPRRRITLNAFPYFSLKSTKINDEEEDMKIEGVGARGRKPGQIDISPPWAGGRSLKEVRMVRTDVNLLGLIIAFNRANPIYGRYISLGQLFIRATPEGLELFHTGEKTETMISRVAIGGDGRLGKIDFLTKDKVRVRAEEIFPDLGAAPKTKTRIETALSDFWSLPEAERRPPVKGELHGCTYRIHLVNDARWEIARLKISRSGNKLVIDAGKEFLGAATGVADDSNSVIDLAQEVPALNYGPRMAALIGAELGVKSDEALAGLFLHSSLACRRAFKPLVLLAQESFPRADFPPEAVLKVVRLLTSGIRQVNDDNWYSVEQKNVLAGEAALAVLQADKSPRMLAYAPQLEQAAEALLRALTQVQIRLVQANL